MLKVWCFLCNQKQESSYSLQVISKIMKVLLSVLIIVLIVCCKSQKVSSDSSGTMSVKKSDASKERKKIGIKIPFKRRGRDMILKI
jgi:ATP-dependent Zn protease